MVLLQQTRVAGAALFGWSRSRFSSGSYSYLTVLAIFCFYGTYDFKSVFRIRISFHSDPDSGSQKCRIKTTHKKFELNLSK